MRFQSIQRANAETYRKEQQMEARQLKRGDQVQCNGYRGVFIREYSCRMVEVSVPGGVVCVDAAELLPFDATTKVDRFDRILGAKS
jgi:hypothetical protein